MEILSTVAKVIKEPFQEHRAASSDLQTTIAHGRLKVGTLKWSTLITYPSAIVCVKVKQCGALEIKIKHHQEPV